VLWCKNKQTNKQTNKNFMSVFIEAAPATDDATDTIWKRGTRLRLDVRHLLGSFGSTLMCDK
jgi:hypothetical protein